MNENLDLSNPDPFCTSNIEILREMCLVWMQRAHRLKRENKALVDILLENDINPSMKEILDRMNKELMND